MTRVIACGRCRVRRTEGEWSTLPAIIEVAGPELATLVSHWPNHMVVVVRACTCGGPIARLAQRATSAGEAFRPDR